MSLEYLNVPLVRQLARQHGRTIGWLIEQMEVSPHAGYLMLREGLLPKDERKKTVALKRLSEILDTSMAEIVLRPYEAANTRRGGKAAVGN